MKRNLEFLGPVKEPRACAALPGSADKIRILEERVAKRRALFADADHVEDGTGLRIETGRNGKPQVVGVEREIAEKQLRLTTVKLDSFSQRLLFLRRRRTLTMTELALRSGLTVGGIFRLETSQREPTLNTAKILAKALEVPLSILAGELV